MKKKAYLLLGRNGDICNLMPVLHHESFISGYKPKLVVAKEYAELLEGVSYVEPVIFNGGYRAYPQAHTWARKKIGDYELINCSVSGDGYKLKKKTKSFCRESWLLSKCNQPWGSLPLIFDRRDKERESEMLMRFHFENKPIILTALKGNSSPMKEAQILVDYLRKNMDGYQVADISEFRAHRFYDLLGLFDKAACLIASDSGPLHLAHASMNLPVISLISDLKDEWHQSAWRPRHILRLFYSEVKDNLNKIADAAEQGFEFDRRKIFILTSSNPQPDDETHSRETLAKLSRLEEEFTAGRMLGLLNYNRFMQRSAEGIGDKPLPFVIDMIEEVCKQINDEDIILIINNDICMVPGISGWILQEVSRYGAAYFHRHDFAKLEKPFHSEAQAAEGKWYCGSDAFAFSKSWWIDNRHIYPDMIFGREAWDMIFRNMIKRAGGTEIHDAIYHQKHKSYWEQNKNCPGNEHNIRLAKEWLPKYGGNWNDWKFNKNQLKGMYK